MSFGYIQGREVEALTFLQIQLETSVNPADRERLRRLIAFLNQKVSPDERPATPPINQMLNMGQA